MSAVARSKTICDRASKVASKGLQADPEAMDLRQCANRLSEAERTTCVYQPSIWCSTIAFKGRAVLESD